MYGQEDLVRMFSGHSDLCQVFNCFCLIDPQSGVSYRLQGECFLPQTEKAPLMGDSSLARQAFLQRRQLVKVELQGGRANLIIACPLPHLDPPVVLELWKDITGNACYDGALYNCGNIPDVMRELGNLATTDSFTGLYNKNTLESRLAEDLRHAREQGRSLCAAMVDIDNFKQINDRYGHMYGDEVIRQIVALLGQYTGGGDSWSARFGGDEFFTVFPGEGLASVQRRCDALEQAISQYPFFWDGQPVTVTASIGAAAFDPEQDNLRQFIDRVDRAMYKNKRRKKAAL